MIASLRHQLHRQGIIFPAFDTAFGRYFSLSQQGRDLENHCSGVIISMNPTPQRSNGKNNGEATHNDALSHCNCLNIKDIGCRSEAFIHIFGRIAHTDRLYF
jgi:hypothetical protein